MNRALLLTIAITTLIAGAAPATAIELKPATPAGIETGTMITKANAAKVAGLVSPGNYVLVSQGMEMKIVPTRDYNWPPPFRVSTEQNSSQVRLGPHGELTNYLAGLPFPILDANDPSIAQKIMWNFQFGPAYSDDLDSQDTEIQNFTSGGGNPFAVYPIGHLAVYRNLGREEVAPAPTDYDGDTGIMERMALGPIIVPIEPPFWQTPWAYMVRYRYSSPSRSDLVWSDLSTPSYWYGYFPSIGNSDYLLGNAFFGNLDFDSLFGFAGRFQDFDFKFLGEKQMLAGCACEVPSRQAVHGRRRSHDLSGGLGAAPCVRSRSRRAQAGPICRHPRDRQADFVYRFPGMVYHRVGSVRPRRQALEDARYFQHGARPGISRLEGCRLFVRPAVSDCARR